MNRLSSGHIDNDANCDDELLVQRNPTLVGRVHILCSGDIFNPIK